MSNRRLARIVATTDVHSSFDDAAPMLAYLHAARSEALIADCGDFFEGSGYYRLGHGEVERQILHTLYDVVAPGNHGWKHHFEPILRNLTVCANAVDRSGRLLFAPVRFFTIAGVRTAVTAVISPQAFDAISGADRAGHEVAEPVSALMRLFTAHQERADAWVVLSHSGFANDLQLADRCGFLDVVFAGHCHSPLHGPSRVGGTVVVKGPELATGCAIAEPHAGGWTATPTPFPRTVVVPPPLAGFSRQLGVLHSRLAAPLGQLAPVWRAQTPDRAVLTAAAAAEIGHRFAAPAVLNETSLRLTRLGNVLRLGDLLTLEPFGNRLVHARWPTDPGQRANLLARLTKRAGPMVTWPAPVPDGSNKVVTTGYLAEAIADEYGGRPLDAGLSLGQLLRLVLTAPTPTGDPS
ncbi:metallophosphoesterase [Yinghuangia seranimata]|uniref:metallophosphoesterase n=1 Tax=Yinghuangia seranimata TaxID=408067 RepID=UPI00248CCDA8|nr:metallophosphoesterase [Yinghuangia seranimata]MDI2127157.1 metallophosphoesterase [Yinghuangia seranimata]